MVEFEKPYIVAAAIRAGELIVSMPRPARHHTILEPFDKITGIIVEPDDQGFLTNDGRYVDRIEGAKIAIEAGQIGKLQWPPYLYSEDLW